MRAGLGKSVIAEAQKFYHDYLDAMYGQPDEDEEVEVPWEADVIRGELT